MDTIGYYQVALALVGFVLTWMSVGARDKNRLLGSGACNLTIEGSDYAGGYYPPTILYPPPITRGMVGAPLYCEYVFRGVPGQRVMLHVRRLVAGLYDNNRHSCVGGRLTLWDGYREPGRYPYAPISLCGKYDSAGMISVKTFSSDTRAEMEYHLSQADPMDTFSITYKFVNIASVCNWQVTLEDCGGQCTILSPGYPGTYPPNTECFYLVGSESPHVSVQLKFFGSDSKPREFELAYSPECREEYLEVYDGNSTESTLMGRFCGADIPDMTTSGAFAYLVLVTRENQPPFGNNGFHATALTLTKEWHIDGVRVPGTHCDWSFNSSRGSVSSPDYWLPKRSSCTFMFYVHKNNYLEVTINIYGLRSDCKEQLDIYENNIMIARICKNSLRGVMTTFSYNLTSSEVFIRYHTEMGQMQAHPDLGFWISFQQLPEIDEVMSILDNSPQQDESAQKVVDYEYANILHYSSGNYLQISYRTLLLLVTCEHYFQFR